MSLEDRSENPSADIIPGPSYEQSELSKQALTKARYDQSFPALSHRSGGTSPFSSRPTPSSIQDVMERSHATTTSVDDLVSSYSYDSTRDFSAYFREINGRVFNNQASTYMLPADEMEFWRLDKQHAAFLVGMGGLYPCPDLVERVLAPKAGETVEMADLGCGTGTWALSMARRFPHVQVVYIAHP